MMRIFRLFLLCVVLNTATAAHAQTVTVSKEMTIRSDVAYDVIGAIKENILLYRDKGSEKVIEVFDNNMKHLYNKEVVLEKKKVNVYCIVPQDSTFSIIYGYREKKSFFLRARKYNEFGTQIDSATYIAEEDFKLEKFNYSISEDRSKTLLFTSRKFDLFYTYVLDNTNMELTWSKESKLVGYNVRKHFRSINVSNDGDVNILFEVDNSRYDRENHHLMLIGLDESDHFYENKFIFDNKLTVDLEMGFDNKNKRIILAGLLSESSEYNASGYFYFTKPINQLAAETLLPGQEFDAKFLEELYGKKLSKKKRLNDFITRDLVLKGDGGFLLFTEMNKEFHRRSAFNGGGRVGSYGGGGGGGWVDIYNEDIVVFSFHPDGTEHWKKILYKKQFSQDDGGVFSSYFLFKTPSRLRIIYNDEIKRNNTVSEYVMDPMGNFERNSLLNTDYQNLKLRFKDAIQISSTEMLVPSERNFKLSLVKVEY